MNKFNAKKVEFAGHKFDSKKEAAFYNELLILKKATAPNERVNEITLQPRFDIIVENKRVGFYKADFKVIYADGNMKIFDVKGYKKGCAYQYFKLKKKLVEAIYNIEIIEI